MTGKVMVKANVIFIPDVVPREGKTRRQWHLVTLGEAKDDKSIQNRLLSHALAPLHLMAGPQLESSGSKPIRYI
jgi:hypothetical protein